MSELTSYEKIPRRSPAEFLNPNQMSIYDELGRRAVYAVQYSRRYVWLGVQQAAETVAGARKRLFRGRPAKLALMKETLR